MTLLSTTLAAVLSVSHAPAVDVVAERPRLEAFAQAIVGAVERAPRLPFTGPEAKAASALALVAIARHESALAANVSDCRVTGDHGRSITAFQLMTPWATQGYAREYLCSQPGLAAELALSVLLVHARCSTHEAMLSGYASGSCARRSKAASRICRGWASLAFAAGLVASCDNGAAIERRTQA